MFVEAVIKESNVVANLKPDRALKFRDARILSAVYFGLLALSFTLLLDAIVYVLGFIQIIPLFEGALLAIFTASIFGALFGKKIVFCPIPFKSRVFILGWLMTILALPVYDIGLLIFYINDHIEFFTDLSAFVLLKLYFVILFESFVLVAFWLAIISGLAAIYLRARIIYYIYDSLDD